LPNIFSDAFFAPGFINGDEELNIWQSTDGVNFTKVYNDVYDGKDVCPHLGLPTSDCSVRDPDIVIHNNQYWMTFSAANDGISGTNAIPLATSSDLINWSYNQLIPTEEGTQVWAPQWFTDSDGSVHILANAWTGGADSGTAATYETHPLDSSWTSWSTPTAITGTFPDTQRIDDFVYKQGSMYYMFWSENSTHALYEATSASLMSGWSGAVQITTGGGEMTTGEGPSVAQLPNGTYALYIDALGSGMDLSTSTDLMTWGSQTYLPTFGAQHPTVYYNISAPSLSVLGTTNLSGINNLTGRNNLTGINSFSGTSNFNGDTNFLNSVTVSGSTFIGDTFLSGNFTDTGTSVFSGNVGIGSSTPSAILSIQGTSSAATTDLLGISSSTGASLLTVLSNGNIGIGSSTPSAILSIQGTSSAATTDLLDISSSTGASLLTVLSNGNIGIGTIAPLSELDINGGVAIGYGYAGTDVAPSNGAIIQGNLGIGTTSPMATLAIAGLSGGTTPLFAISTTTTTITRNVLHTTVFQINGNGTMTVNAPGATSTITGNLYVTGTLRSKTSYNGDLFFANNFSFSEANMATDTVSTSSPMMTQGLLLKNQYGSTTLSIDENGNLTVGGDICGNGEQCFGKSISALSSDMSALASSTSLSILSSTASTGQSLSELSSSVSSTSQSLALISVQLDALSSTTAILQSALATSTIASSTASALTANQSFIQTIAATVQSLIQSAGNWVLNQITATLGIFDRVQTKELCVDDTCITGDQLKQLLERENVTAAAVLSVSVATSTASSSLMISSIAPIISSTTIMTVATSTLITSTSTPIITVTNTDPSASSTPAISTSTEPVTPPPSADTPPPPVPADLDTSSSSDASSTPTQP